MQSVDAIDLLVKGLIIGLVASAPMGPVGVLTVQRTLNKGRIYGWVTGLGAAVSDLLYAMVTGLGMSFVMDFVSNPATMHALQLTGAVMLFLFGIHTYRADPSQSMRDVSPRRGNLMSYAVTGFIVTLSNPLIIFLFVALYARFAFIVPEHPVDQVTGFLGILAGAIGWWTWLTYFINKVRAKFDVRGIVWLNRTIGVVVVVVSLLGFYFTLRGKALY